jgi:acyl-[acyl-carrier-protein]-phospholipid O-acyltransferase / long-chain-fatty-acid--[acyl-carrier-protein] ligase
MSPSSGTTVPSPARGGVVLLHAIARTSRSMIAMEKALRASGFATLNLEYASRKKTLDQLAADVHPPIAHFANRLGTELHFVGHSMGGLLARVYIARHRPQRLGRVVMLGTPNQGSEVADALRNLAIFRRFYGPAGLQLTTSPDATLAALPAIDYCVGVIAGNRSIDPIASTFLLPKPNDGKVSVARTKLAGMSAHVVVGASHPMLVRKKAAIEQTIAFLRSGHFT